MAVIKTKGKASGGKTSWTTGGRWLRTAGGVFLATFVGGCAYIDDLGLSFRDLFALSEEPALPTLEAPVPPPKYNPGDTFVFHDDGSLTEERVIAHDGPLVVWEDNRGRQWTAKANPILPPVTEGAMQRTFSLNANRIFPLSRKQNFRYVISENYGGKKARRSHSCTVTDTPQISIRAGNFDTQEIFCNRDGYTETLYYAPKVGHVVLTIRKRARGDQVKELISFSKAGSAPMAQLPPAQTMPPRMAPQMPHGQMQQPIAAAPSEPVETDSNIVDPLAGVAQPLADLIRRMDERIRALEMRAGTGDDGGEMTKADTEAAMMDKKAKPKSDKPKMTGLSGYGVQLGAYRSGVRARQAWESTFALAAADILSAHNVNYLDHEAKDGGTLIRVIAGQFKRRSKAKRLCDQLKERGLDCWVVKLGS